MERRGILLDDDDFHQHYDDEHDNYDDEQLHHHLDNLNLVHHQHDFEHDKQFFIQFVQFFIDEQFFVHDFVDGQHDLDNGNGGVMQYKTGRATFTNSSAVVTGIGTFWKIYARPGHLIYKDGAAALYRIKSVDSMEQITLDVSYAEETTVNSRYGIVVDLSPLKEFVEPHSLDLRGMQIHLTRSLRIIDEIISDYPGPFNVISKTGAAVALSADECKGQIVLMNSNGTITLPAVTEFPQNAALTLYVNGAYTVVLDPAAADWLQVDGASLGDGVSLSSSGAPGEHIFIHKDSDEGWTILFPYGAWS
jgi:hypothetical protein